jgi:hypothetical protein
MEPEKAGLLAALERRSYHGRRATLRGIEPGARTLAQYASLNDIEEIFFGIERLGLGIE